MIVMVLSGHHGRWRTVGVRADHNRQRSVIERGHEPCGREQTHREHHHEKGPAESADQEA
jgi:hypothetical protein